MKKIKSEDKAGVYITIIFHLVVIIALLIAQIGFSLTKENSFVLDFTRQEAVEKEKQERDFKEDISEKIERMLAESEAGSVDYRNIAVDRGALKDDRGTDAEKLYEDARKLQQELDNGTSSANDEFVDISHTLPKEKKKDQDRQERYSGPSVVSYDLGGRKASHLPIPAYRCMGAGMVTVIITVDNAGNVRNAKVQDALSSPDACLRSFAVRAARMSRFSSDPSAPSSHVGNIVYQFIAQ